MTVQRLVVMGDFFKCWRCGAPATVMLNKEHEGGHYSEICYCDTCWIGETHAYSPLVARDEQQIADAVERLYKPGDDQQKSGVKAS